MTTVITGPNDGLVQGKNLSTKYVGANPDTFELEVVVDEKTIKHDGSAYYVDPTELDIVSKDEGNLVEVREDGVFAGMPDGAVTYDSATGQLMVNGVSINNSIVTAPSAMVGAAYFETLTYLDTPTTGEDAFLSVIPEGRYIGNMQIRRQAVTVDEMDDTYIKMATNGGTTVGGYPAVLGEVRPATDIDRSSASSMFVINSNGIDPIKVVISIDQTIPGNSFKGFIQCGLIRIA